MMLHWLSFGFLFSSVVTVDIDPNLQLNQLRFPWGVNFKFNGLLHHNLARVWVVPKFKIPPRKRFNFPTVKLKPDCTFYTGEIHTQPPGFLNKGQTDPLCSLTITNIT